MTRLHRVLSVLAPVKGVNLLESLGVDNVSGTVREHAMKIVISVLVALLLGTAAMATDASAQPGCWYNGYNHCYSSGHHYGWWRHHAYWHRDHDRWYR
jgi:hypothetical protein